ncbi:helix-turn-helix domain-containing protein [Paenibacillus sp. 2TAB23]|uniref:helix-turn-helix domain-containing protein n=1 Tax=Paenibacillus sp. 2TAB23 TaxID=3233004 RepID=UPI003F9DD5B8
MTKIKVTAIEQLPDVLTPQHIADYIGISRRRIYELCQSGEIKSFLIGASRKIHKSDLLDWVRVLREGGEKA